MVDLAGAGIDFVVAVPAENAVLDLFQENNIGAITTSQIPMWWGDNGQRAGQYAQTFSLDKLDEVAGIYNHHPAIIGDYPVDEPHTADLEHINNIVQRYKELFPDKLPYINLYPNYANSDQLGCTYQEHINQYVQKVKNDYICFDFYPYNGRRQVNMGFLENLDIVSDACRKYNRDMWVILQAGAWKQEDLIDEFQIRWQCYTSLAYGAKIKMHASYSPGWWNENTSMVNNAGEKNPTYYYVKNVNKELSALSDVYMNYTSLGVLPLGDKTSENVKKALYLQTAKSQDHGFNGIDEVDFFSCDNAALVGYFKENNGNGYAMMLVNMANPLEKDASTKVTFGLKNPAKATAYMKGNKTVLTKENGNYSLTLDSGEGIFITIE
jgi:hypothetical protein